MATPDFIPQLLTALKERNSRERQLFPIPSTDYFLLLDKYNKLLQLNHGGNKPNNNNNGKNNNNNSVQAVEGGGGGVRRGSEGGSASPSSNGGALVAIGKEAIFEYEEKIKNLNEQLDQKQRRIQEDAHEVAALREELRLAITQKNGVVDTGQLSMMVGQQINRGVAAVGTYVAQKFVNPEYWRPDHEITNCNICNVEFSQTVRLHHCRQCGEGVCQNCSLRTKPVISRGWNYPVRVCNACYDKDDVALYGHAKPEHSHYSQNDDGNSAISASSDEIAELPPPSETALTTSSSSYLSSWFSYPHPLRKMSEIVSETVSLSSSVILNPALVNVVKPYTTPSYWIPDHLITGCHACNKPLQQRGIHHCRQCGNGFCEDCSKKRREVKSRGWSGLQRVCDKCFDMPDVVLAAATE